MRVISQFCLLVIVCSSASASLSGDERKLLSSANVDRALLTIRRLCGDEFAGRRAGSEEESSAARYLASAFQQVGVVPVHGNSTNDYLQPLKMRYSLIKSMDEVSATLSYEVSGRNRDQVVPYSDYRGAGGLDFRSEVVFVGHGIHAPDQGVDDYAGLDVSGKIVLWLTGESKSTKLKKATDAQKMLSAYQLGARACLVCEGVEAGKVDVVNRGCSGAIADFPYLRVDSKTASELFPIGRNMSAVLLGLKPGYKGNKLRIRVNQVYDPERVTFNVIGLIPGSDPVLRKEIVMVGAHYDHLGKEKIGTFRGADDNASGTSVVLETARAIRASGLSPRRTIVFACWTGEESGLIGSNYFVAHPEFPLDSVVSNIELDMVGMGTPGLFAATGAPRFPEQLRSLASSAADLNYVLRTNENPGASDYLAFMRKDFPGALLYVEGNHPYYHTTLDVPACIDSRVLLSALRLAILSVWRAANPA